MMKNNTSKLVILLLIMLIIISVVTIFVLKKYKEDSITALNNTNENIQEETYEIEVLVEEEEDIGIEGKYDHEEYQIKVEEIAKKYGTVGISVALIDNGKVIDTFAYGSAIKGQLPMTEDTKVRIASISKIFIGLATMLSVEKGTMSLDEDIGTYWGFDVKNRLKDDVITPRSILTHTSSLYSTDDISATYYNKMASRLKSGSGIRGIVSGNIKNYSYNNYALDVLGMTVELANDKVIDDILSESIFDKLEIDAAFYGGDLKDTSQIVTIYHADGSVGMSASRMKTWHKGKPGSQGWAFAGGLIISVKDLGKVIALIANDGIYNGTRYLSENCINELEYHEGNDTGRHWQCQPLCYRTDMYNQEEFYYHTGSAYGVYSLAGYNPVTGRGIAVLTTGAIGYKDDKSVAKVCGEIANILLNIEE